MFRVLKSLLGVTLIGGVIFIGVGDKFLPKPLNTYSLNTRNAINQKLMSLTPNPNIKKPSADREKQVEDLMGK